MTGRPFCSCKGCISQRKLDKIRAKLKKEYLKEREELFGLLARPKDQLSLAEKERERYLKEKLRML